MRCREAVRRGRREGVGCGGDANGMHGEGPTQKAVGTRGAHVEHAEHVRDLGRVEAERLVEFLRGLPSRTRRACDAGRGVGGRWESARGSGGACKRHARADLTRLQGGLGALLRAHARRAHREHANHARDAGRVEVQRLVERPRRLPSRKEDSELSGAGGCLGRRQRTRCTRGGPDCSEQGLHAGGERTQNMPSMVVTLDVSKFTGWLN